MRACVRTGRTTSVAALLVLLSLSLSLHHALAARVLVGGGARLSSGEGSVDFESGGYDPENVDSTSTETLDFGKGKLTIIRNDNAFVDALKDNGEYKQAEQQLKLSQSVEQSQKNADKMQEQTKKRSLMTTMELTKEMYERQAEAAEKKIAEEKSKIEAADTLSRQKAEKEKAAAIAKRAALVTPTYFRLQIADDYCLALRGGKLANGTLAVMWKCDGSDAQVWKVFSDQTIRYAAAPTWCLELQDGKLADDQPIVLGECVPDAKQLWTVMKNGFVAPAGNSNFGITVSQGFVRNSQAIVLRKRVNNDPDQAWRIVTKSEKPQSVPMQMIHLRGNGLTGKCMDVFRDNFDKGAAVILFECNRGVGQGWKYDVNDKTIRLSTRPSYCVTVQNDDRKNGNVLVLDYCGGEPRVSQRWYLENATGLFSLADYKEFVIEVQNPDFSSGTPLIINARTSKSTQLWRVDNF